jgi:hypothetical protein
MPSGMTVEELEAAFVPLKKPKGLKLESEMSTAAYLELTNWKMTEAEFQSQTTKLLRELGYDLQYHTWVGLHSPAGFPDTVALRPRDGRLVFIELKRMAGVTKPAQMSWLRALATAGLSTYLFRPVDRPRMEADLR